MIRAAARWLPASGRTGVTTGRLRLDRRDDRRRRAAGPALGRQRARPRGGHPRRDPGGARAAHHLRPLHGARPHRAWAGLLRHERSCGPRATGDFLTAPELHPFFGRCLARFVAAAWERAGAPARYLVREYGAGRGRLRDDVLAGLAADGSPLAGRIAWQAVDLPAATAPSGTDAEAASETRSEAAPESRRASEPPDLVLANEYLDALPVHRLVAGRCAAARPGSAGETAGSPRSSAEPSDPALAAHLAADGVVLPRGPARRGLPGRAALGDRRGRPAPRGRPPPRHRLRPRCQRALRSPPLAGSLLTYRDHRVGDDPFEAVGRHGPHGTRRPHGPAAGGRRRRPVPRGSHDPGALPGRPGPG